MRIKIAAVQFEIEPFAPLDNLAKAEEFIGAAVEAGAQIIVFPEDFITGPLCGDVTFADYQGRYVQHFQRLAEKHNIDIVPGSIIEGHDDGLYNTAYYIDRKGQIRGRYRKVNLWHPEREYLTAGAEFPVFETDYGRVGLLICWDLIFPEAFRTMIQQDVEIVICPSYWCFEDAGIGLKHDDYSEIKLVDALCTARAFENEIVLVYANAAGEGLYPQGVEHLIGHTQIAVPFKGILQVLDHSEEGMIIQEVNTAILRDAARAYTIRQDLGLRPRLLA
jgi:predicted amidohydrolase